MAKYRNAKDIPTVWVPHGGAGCLDRRAGEALVQVKHSADVSRERGMRANVVIQIIKLNNCFDLFLALEAPLLALLLALLGQ